MKNMKGTSEHQIQCQGWKSRMNKSGIDDFKFKGELSAYACLLTQNQLQMFEFLQKYLLFGWVQDLLSHVKKSQVTVIKVLFIELFIFI